MDDALLSFYGFTGPLFSPAGDAAAFFHAAGHDALIDGVAAEVAAGRSVIEVRGQRGVGKTSLMHASADALRRLGWFVVPVVRVPRTVWSLQRLIAMAAGIEAEAATPPDRLLRDLRSRRGWQRIVLLVDDADALPDAVFQYLWSLTQPFRFDAAQVSLVLFGAPGPWGEVGEMALGRLRRGAVASSAILPLGEEEAVAYLDHMFRRAGRPLRGVMTPTAVEALVSQADGSPARLNALAAFALVEGVRRRRRRLTRAIVTQAVRPNSRASAIADRPALLSAKSLAGSVVAMLTVCAVGLLIWRQAPPQPRTERLVAVAVLPAPAAVLPAPPAPPPTIQVPPGSMAANPAPAPTPPVVEKVVPLPADPATMESPERTGAPGLVLMAGVGDSMATLYARVYRGVTPPPYRVVLAANHKPVTPGSLVVFPEPSGGWLPR